VCRFGNIIAYKAQSGERSAVNRSGGAGRLAQLLHSRHDFDFVGGVQRSAGEAVDRDVVNMPVLGLHQQRPAVTTEKIARCGRWH